MVTTSPARRIMLLTALALACATAWAAKGRDPYAGYIYPAGGKQGTSFQATVGGQNLQGTKGTYSTGEGVRAVVVEYVRPIGKKQLSDVAAHLRVLLKARWTEALRPGQAPSAEKVAEQRKALDPLPDHPWVRDLEKKSLDELEALRAKLFDPKIQPNAQIGEWVVLNVTIDTGAAPGDRELRLGAAGGLTNPLRFQVGKLPEIVEQAFKPKAAPVPVALPCVWNGQVLPGEVDQLHLQAKRGQKLVLTTQARKLIPYLADAVPGWFQPTLTLRDVAGKELAYADDYRGDPDPVLLYEVPQDGEYVVEIKDSIYRGREDFIYRVTVGEQPFIASIFPLGGTEGAPTTVAVTGWNLPFKQVQLDTKPGGPTVRQSSWPAGDWTTNAISYVVEALPERVEVEPNDTGQQGQGLALPQVVNGLIGKAGDVDVFRIEGRAGEEIVAEVYAHRLGSPLDSLMRLIDGAGKIVASNDDTDDREVGLVTNQSDSYLRTKLTTSGVYYLQLSDTQRHGGEDFAYRLRVSAPRPDFALRVTPSSLDVPATRIVTLTAHCLRKDGFAGAIDMKLKNAPPGFVLSGGRIPAGLDKVTMTLAMPGEKLDSLVSLQLEGTALIDGNTITRAAVPAEDMMQAFAYRSLVPAQLLMVSGSGFGRWTPDMQLAAGGPVKIPAGGTVQTQVNLARPLPPSMKLQMQLSNPPKGIVLQESSTTPGAVTLTLKGETTATVGYVDNLIVEAFTEIETKRPDGKPANKQRVSVGFLPAIPIEIVKP